MLPLVVNRESRGASPDLSSATKLNRVAELVSVEGDLDKILRETVDSARAVTGASCAALAVLSADSSEWKTFVTSGLPADLESMIRSQPVGKGLLGLLVNDPRPIRIKDVSEHPKASELPCHHPNMTSFLGVPVRDEHGVVGGLLLADRKGALEFSAEDEALAVIFAKHAATAIENARLLAQTKALLQEYQQLKETRERFYATVSHELRNALTAVYGWAELWLRKTGDNPPRPAVEVYESAEQALMLLEDMLQLSRMDAGKLLPIFTDADAAEIVNETVRSVVPAAAQKDIRLQVVGAHQALPCTTDPVRVRQILMNLLRNAVRHSPVSDVIRIQIRTDEKNMRFEVTDRGEGFPEELHEAIFKAFDLNWERMERGSGLGLDVSRRLARLLGGDIRVKSKPGNGARFILELPRYGKNA